MREYKLTIYAIGQNEQAATDSAVRILNEGANFDEIAYLDQWDDMEPVRFEK